MTFVLVWIGGLVTSHGAGMAVPDWPNTYGYNMFFFPVSKWIGGIFYEHTHRLVASTVGLLTMILALWLHGYKSRPLLRWGGVVIMVGGVYAFIKYPTHMSENILTLCIGLAALSASYVWPKCEPSPKWLRALGLLAFVAVVIQGLLGGFRVTEKMASLGIFHGTLAQLFFLLVSSIALFHTQFWRNLPIQSETDTKGRRYFFALTTVLILTQLALGATMRHQHAGLAIPDFPAAYGKLWPDTDASSIAKYNQSRNDYGQFQPITAFQVVLQMIHRMVACLILISVATCAFLTFRQLGAKHLLARFTQFWLGLIIVQILLGAATIWTGRSADIATAHVACGALSLVTGGLISIISFRMLSSRGLVAAVTERESVTRSGSPAISVMLFLTSVLVLSPAAGHRPALQSAVKNELTSFASSSNIANSR